MEELLPGALVCCAHTCSELVSTEVLPSVSTLSRVECKCVYLGSGSLLRFPLSPETLADVEEIDIRTEVSGGDAWKSTLPKRCLEAPWTFHTFCPTEQLIQRNGPLIS